MRNNIKENILELIQTLYEAHSNAEALIKEKIIRVFVHF